MIMRARLHDPTALVRLVKAYGADTATRLVDGSATLREVGGSLGKAAAALEDNEAPKCRTCAGKGRLKHPGTGKPSRTCPSCHGTGQWTPDGDQADMTPEDASLASQYAAAAKAGSPDAMGRLVSLVGAEVATKLVTGESLSASEFQRGYITACRAGQSAVPGQEPRIPQATHVITPDDFRQGPLTVGRERPAPASRWPGSGSQADYGPGTGTGTRDSLAGLGGTQTGPTAALPARTGW